ncbi:MAG: OmpA family protein [bacterium]|nr:OmpA family protein [bacterium]
MIIAKSKQSNQNIWLHFTDVAMGLLVVFLLLTSYNIIRMKARERDIHNILSAYNETRDSIYTNLNTALGQKLKVWEAVIDRDSLSIVFNHPDFIFETGKDEVRKTVREILKEFFPLFVDVLYKYKLDIVEIRIEGHTNSLWKSETDSIKRYQYNMALSQSRTRSILDFLLRLNLPVEQSKWLQGKISANGLSFSRRKRTKDGKEDFERSKRVEFRIITNAEAKIREVLNKIESTNK